MKRCAWLGAIFFVGGCPLSVPEDPYREVGGREAWHRSRDASVDAPATSRPRPR